MAKAMLYPRLDGMLNGIQMRPGYSKVQVDYVEDAYTNNYVVVPTDDVSRLSESFGHFIQWPQKYIKLCSILSPVEPSMPTNTYLDENALQCMVDEETSCRAESLSQRENPNEAINVESANGMYDQKFMEQVDKKSLIGWMTRDWLDVPIIHWLFMHLYETRNKNSRIAFLNPAYLQSSLCLEDSGLVRTGHWTLLIVDRSMQNGYILDSYNKDEKKKKTPGDFLVVNVLNEACQANLDWTFLHCKQQKYTWECGFYVMKWILDFFMIRHHEFHDNISKYFTTTKGISMAMLDKLVDCTSKAFYEHLCQPCEESI
nr:ulp1 protease family, C-terminal catalytic domain-containing protein [Tanacetum cinerariifolium]